MMDEILTGTSVAPKEVEEMTEGVDPTAAITSERSPSTSSDVGAEASIVPLPTTAVEDDVLMSEAVPEPEPEAPAPAEFMLFLGDFVYADVPVWWGDSHEAYRRLYRRVYNSPRCDAFIRPQH
jgi:alkaline phosphatase D